MRMITRTVPYFRSWHSSKLLIGQNGSEYLCSTRYLSSNDVKSYYPIARLDGISFYLSLCKSNVATKKISTNKIDREQIKVHNIATEAMVPFSMWDIFNVP